MRLPHRIDVLTSTVTTDRRRNQSESWATPTVQAGVEAYVQNASATETFNADGTRLVTGMVAYCRCRTVTAKDRVRWRDDVYLVDGEPEHHETPSGYSHTVIRLRRVEG